MNHLVALLTDFGLIDTYVGVMKAVMKRIDPGLEFVDITHQVRPQSVRVGALALQNAAPFFPEGTTFLVVVDPGVGSQRRPIIVKAGMYTFIAPDNGVLSYALGDFDQYEAYEISNVEYRLGTISQTFHGRDVFAPAAAYAAKGLPVESFGEKLEEIFVLPQPQLSVDVGNIIGEVTHIDHFGNIITSIGLLEWVGAERVKFAGAGKTVRIGAEDAIVHIHGEAIYGLTRAYHELPRGVMLAKSDSNGYLEIAINQGNAANRIGVSIGDVVELKYKSQTGMLS